MAKKVKYVILPALLLGMLFSFLAHKKPEPQDEISSKKKELLEKVMLYLKNTHYNTVELNDDFSVEVFEKYVESLDYTKKFFLKSDIELLERYKTEIDDQILSEKFDFEEKAVNIIEKRIAEAEAYYKKVLDEPFDFEVDETIELDAEKVDYAETKSDLKESWRLAMKYQTLTKLEDLLEIQEQAKEDEDTSVTIKSFEELEAEAREAVLKNNENWFSRLQKLDANDRLSTYINIICMLFDPHTSYFPPKDKENFDISISGRLEGIGATLQEKDGYIKVVEIVPGSASWRQGELKAGHLILKVGQDTEAPVDVVGMRLDEAVRLIRGPKGTIVKLTVKKLDASIGVIPIERDVVLLEQTYAKSAIVKDTLTGLKAGYIKLPKFYVDFNQEGGGRHCSEDVRIELEKIKDEDVSGVILDLRQNGGGSLQDVVDMVGLFIELGPVVQIRSRFGKAIVYSDRDPSITYDGPLVVMVDHISASASEILAAAIQDYGRGVIIGNTSTYGKGTVQRFYGLDPRNAVEEELGALKITTQKFYRIDGGATQIKGVEPDIRVPGEYDYIEIGEAEMDYALEWDEIKPADYTKWGKYDIKSIAKKSESRLEAYEEFKMVDEQAKWLKNKRESTIYPLHLKKYEELIKTLEEEAKAYENIFSKIKGFNTATLKADKETIDSDTVKTETNNKWHKEIEKDTYIYEALKVVGDMD